MIHRLCFVLLTILIVTPSLVHADDPAVEGALAELKPRLVTLVDDAMPLDQAVKALQGQTGNTIIDRRLQMGNPKLKLALKDVTFWEAIDEITRRAKCGYSLYQEDGKLTLVDAPQRRLNTAYAGICRLTIKRVSVTRDNDSNTSFCNVLLELAWEPRFQPFFLDVGPVEAQRMHAGPKMPVELKALGLGQVPVAQVNATEVNLRLPAPPRACPGIQSLSGIFTLTGPSKMLTFRFDNLKQGQTSEQTKEDVSVSLEPRSLATKFWSFDVGIANPAGGPRFDSNQRMDWLVNNRIVLERNRAGKIEAVPLLPNDQRENKDTTARGASLRYFFKGDELPADSKDWSVVYRTPGRIVELTVPFTLKDIPLP